MWLLKTCKDENGAILVEFALVMPIFLLTLAIVLELGLALHRENTLEKSVLAAAELAARSGYPLDGSARTRAENMVKTGSPAGGANLMPGWEDASASVRITTQTYNLDGTAVPYVRVEAEVPYMPLLPGLLDFLGFSDFTLSTAHEEVFAQ